MTESPLLQAHIKRLSFDSQAPPVLQDIRLTINTGEFILLLGRTDAGKSVLGRCLSGVIPAFEKAYLDGTVYLADKMTAETRLADLAPLVSLITDDPHNQLFCPTLAEDLAFGPCNLRRSALEVRPRVQQALEWVKLKGFDQRSPETLSGGEAQRAALASFLTLGAPLLILDRAAGQMDTAIRKDLYKTLARLCRERDQSLIVIDDHFLPLLPLASRLIFLEKGTVVYNGLPDQLPWDLLKSICRPLDVPVFSAYPKKKLSEKDCQPSAFSVQKNTLEKSAPVLEVINLSYVYPSGTFALKEVSMTIHRGEFVAILGPNGAGKTTLIRHFNGLTIGDQGDVRVDSLNTRAYPTAVFADRIGYLFQDPESQLFANTVREEVGFALRLKGLSKSEVYTRVEAQLEELGLLPVADIHPYKLGRSAMQIIALAACLINKPQILVLDEPLSHLSYPRNWEILDHIIGLNQKGLTVILITHDVLVAHYLCTRKIFLENGRITEDTAKKAICPEARPLERSEA